MFNKNSINYYYVLLKFWEYDRSLFSDNIFTLFYLLMEGKTSDYIQDLVSYANSTIKSNVLSENSSTFLTFAKCLSQHKEIDLKYEPVFPRMNTILNSYLNSHQIVTIHGDKHNLSDIVALLYLPNGENISYLIPYLSYLLTLYSNGGLLDFNSVELNSDGPGQFIISHFSALVCDTFNIYLSEKSVNIEDCKSNQELFDVCQTYLNKSILKTIFSTVLNFNSINKIILNGFSQYPGYYDTVMNKQVKSLDTVDYVRLFDSNISSIVQTFLSNNYVKYIEKNIPSIPMDFPLSNLAEFIAVYMNNISKNYSVFMDIDIAETKGDDYLDAKYTFAAPRGDSNLYPLFQDDSSIKNLYYSDIHEAVKRLEEDKKIKLSHVESMACCYSYPQIWQGYLLKKIKEYYDNPDNSSSETKSIQGNITSSNSSDTNGYTSGYKGGIAMGVAFIPTHGPPARYDYSYQDILYPEINNIVIYIITGLYKQKMTEYLDRVQNVRDLLTVPLLIHRFRDFYQNPFLYLIPSFLLCTLPQTLVYYMELNSKKGIDAFNPIQIFCVFQSMLNNFIFEQIMYLSQYVLWIQSNSSLINDIYTEFSTMKIKTVVLPAIVNEKDSGVACIPLGRQVYDNMRYSNSALRGLVYIKNISGYNSNYKLLELIARRDIKGMFSMINIYARNGITAHENLTVLNLLKTIFKTLNDEHINDPIKSILSISFGMESLSYKILANPMEHEISILSIFIPAISVSSPEKNTEITTVSCGFTQGQLNNTTKDQYIDKTKFKWLGEMKNSFPIFDDVAMNERNIGLHLFEGNVQYHIPNYNQITSLDTINIALNLPFDLFIHPLQIYRSDHYCLTYWIIFMR